MTNETHTPGPWRWEQENSLIGPDGQQVAYLGFTGVGESWGGEVGNAADAALIEAAPELLNALKRLLLEFDFMIEGGVIPDVRDDVIFEAARLAVIKAERGK